MTGFVYIPVVKKVPRLNFGNGALSSNQKGSGSDSVQLVSPTTQTLEQAKETLKRNRKESGLPKVAVGPGAVFGPPKGKKPKKPVTKKDQLHDKYKKI